MAFHHMFTLFGPCSLQWSLFFGSLGLPRHWSACNCWLGSKVPKSIGSNLGVSDPPGPNRKWSYPTIHFQGRTMLISGRVSKKKNSLNRVIGIILVIDYDDLNWECDDKLWWIWIVWRFCSSKLDTYFSLKWASDVDNIYYSHDPFNMAQKHGHPDLLDNRYFVVWSYIQTFKHIQ